jgi:hypothetical protein
MGRQSGLPTNELRIGANIPILSAGTNVTLTLVDYSTVYVECKNTSVQVDAVSGLGLSAGRIAEIGSPTVFGPYISGSVKLTATSRDIYYEQQAGVRSIAVGGTNFDPISTLVVVSDIAPSNADGRPNGTIYIQTV